MNVKASRETERRGSDAFSRSNRIDGECKDIEPKTAPGPCRSADDRYDRGAEIANVP